MDFSTITRMKPCAYEDITQDAWVRTLEKLKDRPNARTQKELIEKYQHASKYLLKTYHNRRIDEFRRKVPIVSLTNIPEPSYTDTHAEDSVSFTLSKKEIKALEYYFDLMERTEPLTPAQMATLSRYRKETGFVLPVKRKRGKKYDR